MNYNLKRRSEPGRRLCCAKRLKLLAPLWLALTATSLHASQLSILLVDQNQTPVANAVVELVIDNSKLATVEPSPAIMDQVNRQFSPRVIAITKGRSVNFPNSDHIRHHVYSFSKAKPFEIRLYADNPGAPVEFENAGIVVLGCNIHDKMIGFIYVSDQSHVGVSDKNGLISFNDVPSVDGLTVWHEGLSLDAQRRIHYTGDSLNSFRQTDTDQLILSLPISVATSSSPASEPMDMRDKFRKFGQ